MTSLFENEWRFNRNSPGAIEGSASSLVPSVVPEAQALPLESSHMCVHDLVKVQAQVNPDAIAIVWGERQLTYRELDDRANQLAHVLAASGVATDVPVGLCMQRTTDLVVGALAILKAGGAYVPLDPDHPPNRIAMLLKDCDARLVITQPNVADRIPGGSWKSLVLSAGLFASPCREGAPVTETTPENLAYIIFTSGSTGRPKGVQITHANLLNLIAWHQHAFKVTASDRATMHASPGFDAEVWELWPYLVAGATVHIVDDAIRTMPESLRDWMVATGITIGFVPTALAESMIALPWPAETSLRFLLTGADVLRRYPPPGLPFALVNNYGPTECTVVATSGVVPPGAQSSPLPTVGRAIENVQVYIVDEQQNPVPQGVAGELLIGGAGVGRGYLNLPELTAGAFLPNPFVSQAGARLYRTGDRARILSDGQISFLGRIDEQVKIRGYRIEPGEISAVLGRHPAIESSVVTARADDSGESRLTAYVVVKPDVRVQAGELKALLADQLPAYMVPSLFVSLLRLPITSHGKVDRDSLPLPSPENTLGDDVFEPPQSELEQWLAAFLTTLLGVPRISRGDNFFRLGGHSLMGAQLIARIQQTFGVELSLRGLFDHPTVAGIAAEIEILIHAQVSAMSDAEARRILESFSDRAV